MYQLVQAVSTWMDLSVFSDYFKSLKARYTRYQSYRATVNELSALSDKELQDIGMNRGMIHSVAMEAVEVYTNENLKGWV